jgi:hypothetical protein
MPSHQVVVRLSTQRAIGLALRLPMAANESTEKGKPRSFETLGRKSQMFEASLILAEVEIFSAVRG